MTAGTELGSKGLSMRSRKQEPGRHAVFQRQYYDCSESFSDQPLIAVDTGHPPICVLYGGADGLIRYPFGADLGLAMGITG